MKNILSVLFLFQTLVAWAAKPLAPAHVISAVSKLSIEETGERSIYRALTLYGEEEGVVSLGLEKYKIGEEGLPDKILFQKTVVIPEIECFKQFIKKIGNKSVEATYGCCDPKNIKWDKNKRINFSLKFEDRIFKRGFAKSNGKRVDTAQYSHTKVTHFNCRSSVVGSPKFKIKCDKVKTEKLVK